MMMICMCAVNLESDKVKITARLLEVVTKYWYFGISLRDMYIHATSLPTRLQPQTLIIVILLGASLVSGMGFVHSKPIHDVWLKIFFYQPHSSNPQGMRFSYPGGGGYETWVSGIKFFFFYFITIYIISCKLLIQN